MQNSLLNSLKTIAGQAGTIFLAVGVTAAIGSYQYNIGTPARMGPGFFPFCLGLMLAFIGLLNIASALRNANDKPDPIQWRPLITVTGAVIISALLLLSAGLLIAVPALIIISSLASQKVDFKQLALLVLTLTAMSYLIFVLGLGMPIPLLNW